LEKEDKISFLLFKFLLLIILQKIKISFFSFLFSSAVSYNQSRFCPNATWDPNTATIC
jgi:hypothetical protein